MFFLEKVNHFLTTFLVFPSVLIFGLYLTYKLRGIQFTKLLMGFRELFRKDPSAEGSISQFQAVASVLASNFGTGNIAGMAVALTTGGPGALIWMWVMVFLGSAIQFANCYLGVRYRKKTAKQEYVGGPMYYLEEGLGLKTLAIFFALAVILAAVSVGDFVQINSIALPFENFGIPLWVTGIFLAFLVGIVIFGGAHRVAQVSSGVVPAMAVLYLGSALVILARYYEELFPALLLIGKSALGILPFVGGAAGFSIMKGLSVGFDRAIFATDAGTGTIPLLQSGAKSKHPVIDGVVALIAPYLVMVVCSVTVLVLMVTGAYSDTNLQSTNMVIYAFNKGLNWGGGSYIVLVALFLFGYTTTLAWTTCLERAIRYLFGEKWIRPFLILYVLLIPVGAILHVGFVWTLADIALTMMLLINIVGVAGLSKETINDSVGYFAKSRAAESPEVS